MLDSHIDAVNNRRFITIALGHSLLDHKISLIKPIKQPKCVEVGGYRSGQNLVAASMRNKYALCIAKKTRPPSRKNIVFLPCSCIMPLHFGWARNQTRAGSLKKSGIRC